MNLWHTATPEEKKQAVRELLSLGLDQDQVNSLVHCFNRGEQVKPIEIELMLKLPRNENSGRRPSINVVRSILHDMQVLSLVEKVGPDGKVIPIRTRGGFLRNKPDVVMTALCGTPSKKEKTGAKT